MKYRLAGGNVAIPDYEIGAEVLREHGLTVSEAIRNLFAYIAKTRSVPHDVLTGANDALSARMAAFEELNARIEAAPRVPWTEGESRDAMRALLEDRYV